MNSETILAITLVFIVGATVLGSLNKISRISQIVIIVAVLTWEYWMLGLLTPNY